MTTLDDIKAVATAKPLESVGPRATLSLNAENEIVEAIHALGRFFAQYDSRNSVRLEVRGDKIGYLNRRDFYDDRTHAKLGESQLAILYGRPEYSFIKLTCPVEGCETLILKIHYDERNPERCRVHIDKILQVVA